MTEWSKSAPIKWILANPVLITGLLAVFLPTMLFVSQDSWSTEQGAHGPIVLATGLWLLVREWKLAQPYARPAPTRTVLLILILLLALYYVSRVSAIVEIEGYVMYGLLVLTLFSFIGLEGAQGALVSALLHAVHVPAAGNARCGSHQSAQGRLVRMVGEPALSSGLPHRAGRRDDPDRAISAVRGRCLLGSQLAHLAVGDFALLRLSAAPRQFPLCDAAVRDGRARGDLRKFRADHVPGVADLLWRRGGRAGLPA